IAVVLMLFWSLVVALTITPAIAGWVLPTAGNGTFLSRGISMPWLIGACGVALVLGGNAPQQNLRLLGWLQNGDGFMTHAQHFIKQGFAQIRDAPGCLGVGLAIGDIEQVTGIVCRRVLGHLKGIHAGQIILRCQPNVFEGNHRQGDVAVTKHGCTTIRIELPGLNVCDRWRVHGCSLTVGVSWLMP
ncbi:MAG: hypothetical protein ACPGUF_06025, partial [Litorivicinus sp.]